MDRRGFDIVLFVFVELNRLRQIVDTAVHTHAHIAGFARRVQLLDVLALAPADDWGQHLNLCSLVERHDPIDDLVHSLLLDLLAADRAVRNADTGVEQAQVIVDFRDRANRGARVL